MDLKEVFEIKLSYILKMIEVLKIFQVPNDWWDYAWTDKPTDKNGMHEYGTAFKIIPLHKQFYKEYQEELKKNNITEMVISKGIFYSKK